ncbi:uncharacterized protein LOC129314598 [Prosopis cineraria]|uniref:uncharacterized protein LOC129314598 n=1 Tax=Prosopis cineraria TaxID=364024 RepID=UPI00240F3BCE|nr:uncharacterized protein LOC129314598 [Prosopis cineraria]
MAANQQEEHEVQEDFRYQKSRDSVGDVRTALLTVAVLMATATYQAVLSPPGGLWQDDRTTYPPHVAGVSILGTKSRPSFIMFIFGNTIRFYFSMCTIELLTHGFPLKIELNFAIFALGLSYPVSVYTITPSNYQTPGFIFLMVAIPFLLTPVSWLWRDPKFHQKLEI